MNAICSFRLCKLTDQELLEKIDKQTDEMFKRNKIPAQPDNDFDLLIGELILRYKDSIRSNELQLQIAERELRKMMNRTGI